MRELEIVGIIFYGSLFVAAILILVKTQQPPVIIENKIVDNEVRYID